MITNDTNKPNATTPTPIVENGLRPYLVEVTFRLMVQEEDAQDAVAAAQRKVTGVCNPVVVRAEVIDPQN